MSLELLVGHGSRAAEEKHFFDSHLAPFYRIQQLVLATVPEQKGRKPPSIIAEDNIQLLIDMQRKVDALRANYSGTLVALKDICLKPLGDDCATQSILQASAFDVTYPVNNAVDEDGSGNLKAVVAWEKAFIQLVKVSYLVMFAYISLTLGDTTRLSTFYLSTKVMLGLSGVLGSVGFFSAIGVKSTLIIMEVIPILVLAVLTFRELKITVRAGCFPCLKVHSSLESNKDLNQRKLGVLERYMKEICAPILGIWAVKLVVLLAFSLASICGVKPCNDARSHGNGGNKFKHNVLKVPQPVAAFCSWPYPPLQKTLLPL